MFFDTFFAIFGYFLIYNCKIKKKKKNAIFKIKMPKTMIGFDREFY